MFNEHKCAGMCVYQFQCEGHFNNLLLVTFTHIKRLKCNLILFITQIIIKISLYLHQNIVDVFNKQFKTS